MIDTATIGIDDDEVSSIPEGSCFPPQPSCSRPASLLHHPCTMQCIHAGPTTGLRSGLE